MTAPQGGERVLRRLLGADVSANTVSCRADNAWRGPAALPTLTDPLTNTVLEAQMVADLRVLPRQDRDGNSQFFDARQVRL